MITIFSCKKDSTIIPAPIIAKAGFSFTGQGISPSPVTFSNASTNATSYSWNFGDGSASIQISPSHTYATNGTYSVVLTATNSNGSTTSAHDVFIGATSVKINSIKISNVDVTNVLHKNVYMIFRYPNGNEAVGASINIQTASFTDLTWTLTSPDTIIDFNSTCKIFVFEQLGNTQSPSTDAILQSGTFTFSAPAADGITNNHYTPNIILHTTSGFYNQTFALTWQ